MKRRTLTREERALWAHVQRTVSPFPGRALDDIHIEAPAAPTSAAPASAPARTPPGAQAGRTASALPLATLDRRTLRKVRRGVRDIDGVLDLHGMTQPAAHEALTRFLRRKQREGASLVIVITGKGGAGPMDDPGRERGVLRRIVPHWLRLPELRPMVLGFETTAPHHGGEGSLYVRLRRARGAWDVDP
ncbi:MAG: Smr/MutS family protein [Beijerinckiaceae bacterium]